MRTAITVFVVSAFLVGAGALARAATAASDAPAGGSLGPERQIVAERVFRTGRQVLLRIDGRWYVEIVNRTCHSIVPIPAERVPLWRKALGGGS